MAGATPGIPNPGPHDSKFASFAPGRQAVNPDAGEPDVRRHGAWGGILQGEMKKPGICNSMSYFLFRQVQKSS
jgi:hypothetical protein